MEEFIENFNEFKDWLYNQNPKDVYSISFIRDKFESLGLDNAF